MNLIEKVNDNPERGISFSSKCVLAGTFVTNIGNGMFTLAVSKVLYDITGSFMAFGAVLILEQIISFFIQFIAGYFVDLNNPKKVAYISDLLRGILIVIAGASGFFSNQMVYILIVVLFMVNIINPFYKSANFKLIPMMDRGNMSLLKMNSMIGMLFQSGQLFGVACAGLILTYLSPSVAIIINGFTFIFSAVMIGLVRISVQVEVQKPNKQLSKHMIAEWTTVFNTLYKDTGLRKNLLVCSGDYISIHFFNLMLVPMVSLWYKNNMYISYFDGAFAIGSMLSIILVTRVYSRLGMSKSCWIGLGIQSAVFLLLVLKIPPIFVIGFVVLFGMFNGGSVTIFQTSLQQLVNDSIKGKISSLKNLCISTFSIVLIPIVSKLFDYSLEIGFMGAAFIIFSFMVVAIQMRNNNTLHFEAHQET